MLNTNPAFFSVGVTAVKSADWEIMCIPSAVIIILNNNVAGRSDFWWLLLFPVHIEHISEREGK